MDGTHALLARARARGGSSDDGSADTAGAIGPRHQRPSGRSVVGALLVAVAAVGAFALATPRGDGGTAYVVAARSVEPGEVLTGPDLTTTAIDLPEPQASLAFTDVEQVVGLRAIGALTSGQLVQPTSLSRAPLAPFEVSLSLEADRMLDSRIDAGERVAVLATYGSGPDAITITVASSARVERISKPTGLAVGTASVITLGVDNEADVDAVVHAARAGELTLVRTDSATAGVSYQVPLLGGATLDDLTGAQP